MTAFCGSPCCANDQLNQEPGADTVTRVHGGLSGTSLSAEIGVPSATTRADCRRQFLAMSVGTCEAAEVSAFPDAHAGDKKGHVIGPNRGAAGRRDALGIQRALLSQHQARTQHQSTQDDNVSMWLGHVIFPTLVNLETVEQAHAVGFRQIGLGTAAGSVSGVPGTAAAAIAVGKTDLGVRPAIGGIQVSVRHFVVRALVAGPVIAGVIDAIGERGAIGLSPGEHFMASGKACGFGVIPVVVAGIGIVIQTRHDLAFFRQPGELIQIIFP